MSPSESFPEPDGRSGVPFEDGDASEPLPASESGREGGSAGELCGAAEVESAMAAVVTGRDDGDVLLACAAAPPGPNFGLAVVWAILPLVAQLFVGVALGIAVTVAVVVFTGRPDDVSRHLESLQVAMVPLGTLTTLVLAIFVSWLFFGKDLGRRLGWRGCTRTQWLATTLFVIPLALLASEVGNCVAEVVVRVEPVWLRAFRESGGELFRRFVELPWLIVFVGGCLFPGIGEEVYCRGFISRGLVARYGVVVGTLTASFLFGAMHLDPIQSSAAFAIGIGLQYVFLATRSLGAAALLHTLNNVFAIVMLKYSDVFPIPGITHTVQGVAHTPIVVLAAALASLVAVAVLLFQTRTRWLLPGGLPWSPGYLSAERPPDSLGATAVSAAPHAVVWLAVVAAYLLLVLTVLYGVPGQS